ncbi:MAG: hypothetical protein HQL65_14280 [Magnetococcales bacterium]|nr:hypothetical protein [Magnetococcales bacterium]
MSARKYNNEIINHKAVNQLRHGMRQIWREKENFGKSVAAWRLYKELKKILGS